MNGTYTNGTDTRTGPAIVAGRVVRVKGRGFLLECSESWLNVSKWATDITMPRTGDDIQAELDRAGFVRTLEVVGNVTRATHSAHNGAGTAPPAQQAPDTAVVRIAALQAAVALVAALPLQAPERQNVDKAGDAVLALAERFAEWVQG